MLEQLTEDRIALFDLDLTLIDESYRLTNDSIIEVAQRAISAGWVLGLSSDTPRAGMEYWRRKLGFNGPLVVEKGAGIAYEGVTYPTLDNVIKLGELGGVLAQPLGGICDRLWVGDAPGIVRDRVAVGEPGEEVILLNNLRRFSFSLYGGVAGADGTFHANHTVLDRAVGVFRRQTSGIGNLDEDISYDYGIMIAHDTRTNKRRGSERLLQRIGATSCVMVGNSTTDYIGNDIAYHYAVANATEEFRGLAQVVTKTPLTDGCIEVINGLLHR